MRFDTDEDRAARRQRSRDLVCILVALLWPVALLGIARLITLLKEAWPWL
jgi:hypothetical protein